MERHQQNSYTTGRKERGTIGTTGPFLEHDNNFSYHKAQVLTGRLNHITYILPQLQCYLRRLYTWQMEWVNKSVLRPVPQAEHEDLKRWKSTLEALSTTRLIPNPDPTDVGWWGDASTSYRVGILIGKRWETYKLRPEFKVGAPIAWIKTLAVRIGLLMLERLGARQGRR